jgi:hypothetical protein
MGMGISDRAVLSLDSSGIGANGPGIDDDVGGLLHPARTGKLPVPVNPGALGMTLCDATDDVYAFTCARTSSRTSANFSFIMRARSRSDARSLRPRR